MSAQQVFRYTLAVLAALATAYIMLASLRILIVLLIAIIIASAVRPLIGRLKSIRIPEGLAVILVYGGIALSILLIGVAILPPVINRFADYLSSDLRLANRIIITKSWIETNLGNLLGREIVLSDAETIQAAAEDVVRTIRNTAPDFVSGLSGTIGEVVLVFVMGVYWLASRDKSIEFVTQLASSKHRETTRKALFEIEESMGSYVRGIVFVALFVGMANFVILLLLGIPNAATFAFIIGLTTMLPVVGGFIGGISATLLGLLSSPLHGLAVFGVFVLVQQAEVHYLTPRMMARSIGVDPLLVMVAVFVGFVMYGVMGAIIAIPILGTISILLRDFVIKPHRESNAAYDLEKGVVVFRGTEDPTPTPGQMEAIRPIPANGE